MATKCKKNIKRVFTQQKTFGRCITRLKHNDSCQKSSISLNILSPFFYFITLFVTDKGNCVTSDKLHAHNSRSSFDHQYVQKLGTYYRRPHIVGSKFCNKNPAHNKWIKDSLHFERKLKHKWVLLLIWRFYQWYFIHIGCWSSLIYA
jgi:hypothetical protein